MIIKGVLQYFFHTLHCFAELFWCRIYCKCWGFFPLKFTLFTTRKGIKEEHCKLYLWTWSHRRQLAGEAAGRVAAKHWCGLEEADSRTEGCVSFLRAPLWCGCRRHKTTPRSSCFLAVPTGAVNSASWAGALGEDRGACSPPLHSYRCSGAGSWAGSSHCAGTTGRWTRRVDREPQLASCAQETQNKTMRNRTFHSYSRVTE